MSHDHDHGHNESAPMVDEISDFEALEIAVREICIEKGLFSAEDHRKFTEFAEHIGPTPAARMVAKAWLDPEYKKQVMTDAVAASKAVGVDYLNPTGFGTPSDYTDLRVLEDTPSVHHVVVCTLCSCYPRPIRVVSDPELSSAFGSLAAAGACRVRADPAGGG
jgi:nitrile hydratase